MIIENLVFEKIPLGFARKMLNPAILAILFNIGSDLKMSKLTHYKPFSAFSPFDNELGNFFNQLSKKNLCKEP